MVNGVCALAVASFPGLHPAFVAYSFPLARSHYVTHTERGRPGNKATLVAPEATKRVGGGGAY